MITVSQLAMIKSEFPTKNGKRQNGKYENNNITTQTVGAAN